MGVVDLVYEIHEGDPYLLGELEICGNDRTRDKVIRREATRAGLLPGEVLDENRIEISKRRLMAPGYSIHAPEERNWGVRTSRRPEGRGRFGCLEGRIG